MELKEAAEAYCNVIEAAAGSDRLTFVTDVARTLAAAVAAAYLLPDVEWTSEVDVNESSDAITHEQWLARFSDIQGVVGEWGVYWTAPKAYRVNETTLEPDLTDESYKEDVELGHLADDLADTWRDLRNGLNALNRGQPEDDVIWEWRFSFRTHWGAHAVDALRALHQQATA